jgi:transcriptional regulator of acetoin/glycerol metabolism
VSWTAGAALQLPPDHRARTLILRDVDALTPEQQQQVLGWLQQDRADVQVVATSARPVWPLVESGHFDASLYYALNVVCLVLST